MSEPRYEIVVTPLSAEEGGGYVARIPDLPGCVGDGETPEAAVADVREAVAVWSEAQRLNGLPMPEPGWGGGDSVGRGRATRRA